MRLDTFDGVPIHPLLVHLPVVLVPLALVAIVLAIAVPRWRSWAAPVALALAVLASVGTYLAQESGPPLEERVEDSGGRSELLEEHTEMGETLLPWVLVFTGLLVAAVAVPALAGEQRRQQMARAVVPLLVLAGVSGGLATWKVYEVGHSGARAAWEDVSDGG
jgi:uncharacterized membrane protein